MPKPFGEKIKERRIELRLTLEKVAELIGSSKNYVWELEQKTSKNVRPSAQIVVRLARALSLPVEYLIDDDLEQPTEIEWDTFFVDQYQQLSSQNKELVRRIVQSFHDVAQPSTQFDKAGTNAPKLGEEEDIGPSLSTFLSLQRRKLKLSPEDLAKLANIEKKEILKIEADPTYVAKPRTVHKLADYLRLPERALSVIAGATTEHRDSVPKSLKNVYAAQSDNLSELSRNERKLLAEYVDFLKEMTD